MQVLAATIDGVMSKEGNPIPNPLVTQPFIERFGLMYPVGSVDLTKLNEFGQYSPMVRTYVPFLFFIDRQGVIRAQYQGSDAFFKDETNNFRLTLDGLIAAKAAPAKPVPQKKAAPPPPAAKKKAS